MTQPAHRKGKLIPVQVPWRVSLSTPFLTVRVAEFEERQIEFVATFWSQMIGHDERKVKVTTDARVVNIKSSFDFDGSIGIENFDYDRSEIDLPSIDEDIAAWGKRFTDKWNETGICPNPRMYEVIESEWITASYNTNGQYKHYLIIGEVMAVEFLCEKWTWEAGQTINWFKNGEDT